MIIIASSNRREAAALAGLCENRTWPCFACTSTIEFGNLLERTEPRAIVARHQLSDGYSDDLLALLKRTALSAKMIVLAPANFTIEKEARQIALGADCVLRDPVRIDVLAEYLARYRSLPSERAVGPVPAASFEFGGAHVFPQEHRIKRNDVSIRATPQVIEFLRILSRSPGRVVSYQTLYAELLGRAFAGDTVNMRVLLGRTAVTLRRIGINLRELIHIIPKVGYQYRLDGVSDPDRKPA